MRIRIPRPAKLRHLIAVRARHSPVGEEEIKRVLSAYDLGWLEGYCQPAVGHTRSQNLILQTNRGTKVLKRYKISLDREAIAYEHSVLMCLDAAGFLVALSGQVLRALVIGLAYIKRGGKNRRIAADSLVQDGVFAHSRNPLYTGNILFLVGLSLIHNSVWMYLVGLPFFMFAYHTLVLAEEAYLSEKFGEVYDDYCRRVNRFIPSFSGLGGTIRSMAFDWKRVIRKEYGTTFAWLTGVLGLLAWESIANFGYEACKVRVAILAALWMALIAGYFSARLLKKLHFLDSN